MSEKYKKVVIIGNGMDMDHGFKTSYKDIFKCFDFNMSAETKLIKSLNDENGINWWSDFENILSSIAWAQYFAFKEIVAEREFKYCFTKRQERKIQKNLVGIFKKYAKGKMEDIDNYRRDHFHKILEHMINEIALLYFEPNWEKKLENPYSGKIQEYKNDCKKAFIINYNYTKFYEKYYYESKDCWHIHGNIVKGNYMQFDGSPSKESAIRDKIPNDGIQLGTYFTNEGYSHAPTKKKFQKHQKELSEFTDELDLIKEDFRKKINSLSLSDSSNRDYWTKRDRAIASLKEADELIIIGHSLTGTDIPPLKKIYSWDAKNIKRVKYYGHLKCKDESEEKNWIQERKDNIRRVVSSHLNDENITIINNYRKM